MNLFDVINVINVINDIKRFQQTPMNQLQQLMITQNNNNDLKSHQDQMTKHRDLLKHFIDSQYPDIIFENTDVMRKLLDCRCVIVVYCTADYKNQFRDADLPKIVVLDDSDLVKRFGAIAILTADSRLQQFKFKYNVGSDILEDHRDWIKTDSLMVRINPSLSNVVC